MDWLFTELEASALFAWEETLSNGFYVFSLAFLVFEFLRYRFRRQLTWLLTGDTLTNIVTQLMFAAVTFVLLATFYLSTLAYFHEFAVFDISISWATVGIAIVAADLAYYWEHRFCHRVALAWATHTVHHSSPHFNISVAYRFGPLDAFWPVLFHVPLVVLGFDPFVVGFAELFVLLYQTPLHTESIAKLPAPIEAVFNTPSHHRVHHGVNPQYIDSNYAGMLIIWDRMFGTFAEEREPVEFGITEPILSVNPLTVFCHGFVRLGRRMLATRGFWQKLRLSLMPPGRNPARLGSRATITHKGLA